MRGTCSNDISSMYQHVCRWSAFRFLRKRFPELLGCYRFFYAIAAVVWFGGQRVRVRVAADGSAALAARHLLAEAHHSEVVRYDALHGFTPALTTCQKSLSSTAYPGTTGDKMRRFCSFSFLFFHAVSMLSALRASAELVGAWSSSHCNFYGQRAGIVTSSSFPTQPLSGAKNIRSASSAVRAKPAMTRGGVAPC